MIKQLVCRLFSGQCQLTSLRLDISSNWASADIHQCLASNFEYSSHILQNQLQSSCLTLRRLCIRLDYICFLENLIERVPNLERLSVQISSSLKIDPLWQEKVEALTQSNENWFDTVSKKNR